MIKVSIYLVTHLELERLECLFMRVRLKKKNENIKKLIHINFLQTLKALFYCSKPIVTVVYEQC